MGPSVRLGRIADIEVELNWTLLVIFALLTWSLATGALPQAAPRLPVAAYWWVGAATAAALGASLLAHELAHALVARAFGVRVAGITLWLFGGTTRLAGEPPSARVESVITAIGPATSLLIGGAATLLAAGPAPGPSPLARAAVGWIGATNLLLALFNLLPAFPLDGGRLLAALLWWRSGSRGRGVRGAARVGRVIAVAMVGLGVFVVLTGDILDGAWVGAIGWFLLMAAGAEETGATIRTLLRGVPIADAMTSPVITVPAWLTVAAFLESDAARYHFTTYPLHDRSGTLVGVVRLRQLVGLRPEQREQRLLDLAAPVGAIPIAAPSDDLGQVLERLGPGIGQRVLVMDGRHLAGIVSPVDVARVLALRGAVASRRPRAA